MGIPGGTAVPPPIDADVVVDIRSLEDFQAALDRRLSHAQKLLDRVRSLAVPTNAAGTLPSSLAAMQALAEQCRRYEQNIQRLRDAVAVARAKTREIATAYRTSEERSTATANAVATRLSSVGTALGARLPAGAEVG
jgi:hypothetical protein